MAMVESIDDITRQARQGSVAAIIQILNARLADCGVRTRAVLAEGILQLLCEAATAEHLERQSLVRRVRTILESLQPRHIRRVKINSRIVREQQLLWLDEIKKDPEGQLLWSEEIYLPAPNPLKVLMEDLAMSRKQRERIALASSSGHSIRDRRQFWRGIVGGAGISIFLLLIGWIAYDLRTRAKLPDPAPAADNQPASTLATSESPAENTSGGTTQASNSISSDPFAQAVSIAEQAAIDGQAATTPAEWLDLASRWQRASDLMSQVAPDDGRYVTAQDRHLMYRQNSEQALQQAELLQGQ